MHMLWGESIQELILFKISYYSTVCPIFSLEPGFNIPHECELKQVVITLVE